MRKEQWNELGDIIDSAMNQMLANELEVLLDNEVIKPEFHNAIVARIKKLRSL